MSSRKLLSIGDVSKLTGIHIKSLRYYDRIGVLKPAYTDPDTNYRYYTYSQLSIVEAIRLCIELDIPLKEFAQYAEDGGEKVHYAKLLERGKEVAEQKFRAIRDGLQFINNLQEEIRRSDGCTAGDTPTLADMPRKRYMLEPISAAASDDDFYRVISGLYLKADAYHYKAGNELGILYVYRANGGVERFLFIEILSLPKGKAKETIVLPAGEYQVRHVNESQIETAPELFPELFQKGLDLVVIESELLTGEYSTAHPLYELRCSVSAI